ncbi:MAG: hypothetical protein LBH24_05830, partial [Clostridiales bacterium]|nr:hypothetical protein [Clostridiales bacterium]
MMEKTRALRRSKFCFMIALIAAAVAGLVFYALRMGQASPFAAADGTDVIDPIARYEFRDASDPGKDSMGKYHLTARSSGGTPPVVDPNAGTIKFNKNINSVLRENNTNMLQDVTSITLAAQIVMAPSVKIWETPLGFGR